MHFGMEDHAFQLLTRVQMDFHGMVQFVFKMHLYVLLTQHGMEYHVNQLEMLIVHLDQFGTELLVVLTLFIAQRGRLGMETDVHHQ